MKKVLILLAFAVMSLTASAQDVYQRAEPKPSTTGLLTKYIKPGVHPFFRAGGVGSDYVVTNANNDFGTRWGFTGEAGINVFFKNSFFGVQTALRYVTQGGDLTNIKITQHSMQIPVNITMTLTPNENNRFQLAMGPYFGYGLGGDFDAVDIGIHNTSLYDVEVDGKKFNHSELGCGMDATYQYKKVQFTFGMSVAFTHIHDGDFGEFDNGDVAKWPRNRSFRLTVGYEL